ncbi:MULTISPECIES: ParB/RepB/Spo0J family partition protein [unclassified Sphingopyxis]|jgi:ParB family chromosome partitioning protein|uniref:ParB/RepB/Spo0J family partition protein n=1 Tax=unclassified Sphingopyxis TaxID=2614943 RepID=UPI000BA57A66|nr:MULTISPECIES: ParB/RepB/Spo0J family partition protein [unclassified Sphingopyxis]PAL19701.1 chromosome partitioning protein ParB [Sphingopyxis sp. GW247-27LB]HET6525441.1 ParB/RepB/Spo0J family partition protein [Sphingopyxis sp.]HMO73795.1 ParB/RepB/Spo0J family partition protein [Sphingopyxis sp.]HMP43627.1 ParB/RepB/Spo0J family partition protein [Sphingopyxis sp.]
MASKQKIILSQPQAIPLDRLRLSKANVRRVKPDASVAQLADSIARRGLLHNLNVRPILDSEGNVTGDYEVPAGGRRIRALELLVKQKRLAKDAPIPCNVRPANDDILAEEDSLAENAERVNLHPLDQFRGMQSLAEKGNAVEDIAAHFFVTPAVVRQRLKLAGVSPKLLDIYAEDGMSLEVLMAFTVSDDEERQIQVWEMVANAYQPSPSFIRQKLTENSVRAADKRVRFVGMEAYVEAGGSVVRDLFEADRGGWLTDPALIDRLVAAKLEAEGLRIGAEGWKWIEVAEEHPWNPGRGLRTIAGDEVPMSDEEAKRAAELEAEGEALSAEWSDVEDVPDEVHARLEAIDAEISRINERPINFDPADVAIAGAFVSIDNDGTLRVERGFVKPEDEAPPAEQDGGTGGGEGAEAAPSADGAAGPGGGDAAREAEEDESGLKPLSERLVSDLTAWRTLALQDAFAQSPATAYIAVLHAFVLSCFYGYSRESCLQTSINSVGFSNAPAGLRDCAPGQAIAARIDEWRGRLPKTDKEVWDWLLELGDDDRANLLAHCASLGVNAQAEIVKGYDGRVSAHGIARRLAHSHILARAVGLDVVEAGWRPTADGYLNSVPKPRILADVTEARGENFAGMIDHLKKGDMAREAERLLEDAGWLPEPMRTPELESAEQPDAGSVGPANDDADGELPAFLAGEGGDDVGDPDAIAAE